MRITGTIDPSTHKNVPKVFARDKKDAKVIPLPWRWGGTNSRNTDPLPAVSPTPAFCILAELAGRAVLIWCVVCTADGAPIYRR